MLLTSIPIANYQNINSFSLLDGSNTTINLSFFGGQPGGGGTNQWVIREGEANTLYFQIADIQQNLLRFIPQGSPVSMTVTFTGNYSYNQAVSYNYYTPAPIVKVATQVDPSDGSIWSISILPTDEIYSGNVYFSLTNGTQVNSWIVNQMISVQDTGTDSGGC